MHGDSARTSRRSLLLWLLGMIAPAAVTSLLLLKTNVSPESTQWLFLALCGVWAFTFTRYRADAARWASLPSKTEVHASVLGGLLWTGIAITVNFILILPVLGKWLEPCHNIIQREIRLDAARRAVVFHRECVGTANLSTHVSVLVHNEELPRSTGNVLVLGGKGEIDEIRWDAPTRVTIRVRPDAKVVSKQRHVWDVDIEYAN